VTVYGQRESLIRLLYFQAVYCAICSIVEFICVIYDTMMKAAEASETCWRILTYIYIYNTTPLAIVQ